MSNARPLVIFGAGSVARLAYYHATEELGLQVSAFAVDTGWCSETQLEGLPVVDAELLHGTHPPSQVSVFVAVGYSSMLRRARAWRRIVEIGWYTPSIISPRAHVAKTATIGPNCFIMPGAVIEPDTTLGSNNTVWSNATICHNSMIGSHNFFASNSTLGGETIVGDRCFFGFSSTVLQQRIVGSDVLVAAASLVTSNAPSLGRYMGMPARRYGEIDADLGVCVQ